LFALGQALESQRKPEAAKVIYGNLIKRFPAHPKLAEMQEKAAGSDPVAIIQQLTQSRLENPDQYGINKNESFKYVDACEAYAISDPEDPRSPEYLFDAAEIAKLLKTYNKALSLYDWMIDKYPNYSKTPSALFIKAFTLENELGKLDEAKAAYELFLEKYPQDNFADDAKFSLENIGKSPDEVLKSIEAKAKANQ
jgi:TolA-binding protein